MNMVIIFVGPSWTNVFSDTRGRAVFFIRKWGLVSGGAKHAWMWWLRWWHIGWARSREHVKTCGGEKKNEEKKRKNLDEKREKKYGGKKNLGGGRLIRWGGERDFFEKKKKTERNLVKKLADLWRIWGALQVWFLWVFLIDSPSLSLVFIISFCYLSIFSLFCCALSCVGSRFTFILAPVLVLPCIPLFWVPITLPPPSSPQQVQYPPPPTHQYRQPWGF